MELNSQQSPMERLSSKVGELISRLESSRAEVANLRAEVAKLSAQNEAKSQEISRLYDEMSNAGIGVDDIISDIDKALEE